MIGQCFISSSEEVQYANLENYANILDFIQTERRIHQRVYPGKKHPLFFFFFFFFPLSLNCVPWAWNQILSEIFTFPPAAQTPNPLTHCARPGIKPES